jgi:glycine/D-amino acid oxidase-like deaminating enzyme
MTNSDVAIIGAGLTGSFCAFLLAREGIKVALYDPFDNTFQASSTNPGGINPLHGPGIPGLMESFHMDCFLLHNHYQEEIASLSGIDFKYRTIERLFLTFNTSEVQAQQSAADLYNKIKGFEAEWLSPQDVLKLDRRISSKTTGGLFTFGNAVVDSILYTKALHQASSKLGATIIKGSIDQIRTLGQNTVEISTDGNKLTVDTVCIAAGFWSNTLYKQLGFNEIIKPVKGEMLTIQLNQDPFNFDITNGLTGLYQADNTNYWLGGTRANPMDSSGVTDFGKNLIINNVKNMLPGLKDYKITHHGAGYRPTTPDDLPVAGRLPGYNNIYTANGGGSKGVLLSTGLAQHVFNQIINNSPQHSLISPGRFQKHVLNEI